MSNYVRYYKSKQLAYADFATKWSRWAETAELSDAELKGIAKFFKPIGVRFGLVKVFRDLGVI